MVDDATDESSCALSDSLKNFKLDKMLYQGIDSILPLLLILILQNYKISSTSFNIKLFTIEPVYLSHFFRILKRLSMYVNKICKMLKSMLWKHTIFFSEKC